MNLKIGNMSIEQKSISFETSMMSLDLGYPVYDNRNRSGFYNKRTKTRIPFGWTGRQQREHLTPRPTQALLQCFLRDRFNIYTNSTPYCSSEGKIFFNAIVYTVRTGFILVGVLDTYEEALEAALKKACEIAKRT